MDPDLFRVALRAIFAPVVAEIPDQFLFLGVDGDHRLLFSQSGGYLAVDIAELRIPVGVAVALRGLAVALQTVTCLIEQVADQGAADFVTLRLQRLRQTAHALAGPPQRRFRIPAGRRLDQGFEIGEQRRVLGNRRLAPRARPPNPFRRLILRQFLQAPPDRARRNPSRHRDRRDPTITRGECLRRRAQTTAPFIEQRAHRRHTLSDRFDIDHHHNIWYSNLVVNPYITLSKVDSIIYGRALRPFLYYKGFHALEWHRIGHWLWGEGGRELAHFLQSRVSQVLAINIHPAVPVGRGVFIDHGTGLVVGETAVIGDDVSILHEVTLGGTGKERGDRHPKVRDGVLLCTGAKVLGNVEIGRDAKVGAGSVVLHDVPPRATVAGVPARIVGWSSGSVPALEMDQSLPDYEI